MIHPESIRAWDIGSVTDRLRSITYGYMKPKIYQERVWIWKKKLNN